MSNPYEKTRISLPLSRYLFYSTADKGWANSTTPDELDKSVQYSSKETKIIFCFGDMENQPLSPSLYFLYKTETNHLQVFEHFQ